MNKKSDTLELPEAEVKKQPIEDMPLETLRDYRLYNEEARRLNKKLKMCRYPIKQCPVELHPHVRVIVSPTNKDTQPFKVHVSNDVIHFDKTLVPGQTYDLPEYIVHYLSEKGIPKWKIITKPDGSKDSVVSHMEPRFAVRTVFR